jgi:hypothetical protein
MSAVTSVEIEAWLRCLKTAAGKPASPRTQTKIRNLIGPLVTAAPLGRLEIEVLRFVWLVGRCPEERGTKLCEIYAEIASFRGWRGRFVFPSSTGVQQVH